MIAQAIHHPLKKDKNTLKPGEPGNENRHISLRKDPRTETKRMKKEENTGSKPFHTQICEKQAHHQKTKENQNPLNILYV